MLEDVDGYVLVNTACNEDDGHLVHLHDIECAVRAHTTQLWDLNCYIHDHPELGYHEFGTHDVLTQYMRKQCGWHVTSSAFGMDTAWLGEYDTGKAGPTVAFNAEMDALPNLGHACGHNLIAVGAVAAALATAIVLRKHKLGGKVIIVGTPAEENGGGGKIKCLDAGAYKDVDFTIISHPGILNNSPMVRTTAYTHLEVSYKGRAAHAANSPWRGINALDALVIAYNAVSVLRQQLHPDDIVGLQITNGGNKPNVIHEFAAGVAVLRAASSSRLAELLEKVKACFRAGAEATGAEMSIEMRPGYKDHVPNRVLADSFRRYWSAMPDIPAPALPPPGQLTWVKASTDQGNLSYALPSMNVSFAIPPGVLAGQPHSPDFEKASRTRGAFDRAMRVAKAMAGTAVDVMSSPVMLEQVHSQWEKDMADARIRNLDSAI